MKRMRFAAWCALAGMLAQLAAAHAQGIFRTELKNRYDFRTVSCYTCHKRMPPETENPKRFRNDFGKLFEAQLAGKNVTERLAEVKGLKRDDPKRQAVEAKVKQEFLEALEKVEQMKYPGGGTYADALKAGKIEGIKLR